MNKKIARAELRHDYEVYLRRQRGLSERTIFHSWRIADRFLEFRFGKEIGDLSRVTTTDIVGFLQHLTTRTPPLRDKTLSSHLRNFLNVYQSLRLGERSSQRLKRQLTVAVRASRLGDHGVHCGAGQRRDEISDELDRLVAKNTRCAHPLHDLDGFSRVTFRRLPRFGGDNLGSIEPNHR